MADRTPESKWLPSGGRVRTHVETQQFTCLARNELLCKGRRSRACGGIVLLQLTTAKATGSGLRAHTWSKSDVSPEFGVGIASH